MSDLPPLNPPPALVSGVAGMGDHYRVRIGDLAVVTGIPNYGKSSFVLDVACHMALRHKWIAAVASFETITQTTLRRILRTFINGRRAIEQDVEELDRADAWINEWFRFVVPDDNDDVTLDWLLERLGAVVVREQARLAIIDPWNEIDHDRPRDLSMTEYIGARLRQLRRFARRYRVHLIVVAHPAKVRREGATIPVPTLYDVAESAHFYNRADVGIIVHREGDRSMIRVVKTRDHDEIGVPGDVFVRYVRERATYEML